MFSLNAKIIILLCVLLYLIFPDFNYSQENYEVTNVSVTGNDNVDTKTILNTITFNSVGWFSRNILRDEPFLFNSEILKSDLANIVDLYQREGFIFASVKSEEVINDENRSVAVLFRIDEESPILVDSVSISSSEDINNDPKNLDSLISVAYQKIKLIKGQRFRDEDVRSDQSQIIDLFLNNGYPHVKIIYNLTVYSLNCSVMINWYINPGPISSFGQTSISGFGFYPQSLISSKLKYSEGNIYDASKLTETQIRLQDLGIFYGVHVNSILNNDPKEIIPVQINIVEAKRFRSNLGVGYGTDEKFRVELELTYLGFLRGPGKINFEARRSEIEKFSFKLGYNRPEFIWERATFRLNTFATKVDELPYEENSIGFNIGVFHFFSRKFSSSITYIAENIKLNVNSIALQRDSSQIKDKYSKSAINIFLRINYAEPYVSPVKGFNLSLSATYSGIGIKSPYKFFKSIIQTTNYHSIYNSLVVGVKLSLGYLKSLNDTEFIPVEERFYLGGSSSVRGWERFELGPKDVNGIPKGGNSFLEGSIELRYPTIEKIYGVLFLDLGNVWELTSTYKVNELQYALGFGIRYETPIGPIRLDYAKPIFNEKHKSQFWFSIGHAF